MLGLALDNSLRRESTSIFLRLPSRHPPNHQGTLILREIKRRRKAAGMLGRMPWSEAYYPPSMKNLPPEVRHKAIEIANALLREGFTEGQAIRIAIARAKRWALQPGHLLR
jgi:hypothetical protein